MLIKSFIVMTLWFLVSSAMNAPFTSSMFILSIISATMATTGYVYSAEKMSMTMLGEMSPFSFIMIMLSLWIIILMYLNSMSYSYNFMFPNLFSFNILALLSIMLVFFYTKSMLVFYMMFELSLLPTLMLITKWGYQPERLNAGFYFMMYTVCASLPLLFSIMNFKTNFFTLSMQFCLPFEQMKASSNSYLYTIAFTIPFLVKLPMWGVHLWLPKAHVEAPVSGSMILAGILLKLGGYGLMTMYPMYMFSFSLYLKMIMSMNLWGLVVISLVCLCSIDMKVLIAYSSVTHMGMVILGLLSGSVVGHLGAMLMMVVHGLNSSGLFSLINFNYESTNTRNMSLQKGMMNMFPTMYLFWFILLCSNMSAPPSLSLISEIFICMSMMKISMMMSIFIIMATFLAATYNIYLFSCQAGKPSKFTNFSNKMSSNMILSSFMHITPIYLGVFCSFYMYM